MHETGVVAKKWKTDDMVHILKTSRQLELIFQTKNYQSAKKMQFAYINLSYYTVNYYIFRNTN